MQRKSPWITADGMSGRSLVERLQSGRRDDDTNIRGGRRVPRGIPLIPLNPTESRIKNIKSCPGWTAKSGRDPGKKSGSACQDLLDRLVLEGHVGGVEGA